MIVDNDRTGDVTTIPLALHPMDITQRLSFTSNCAGTDEESPSQDEVGLSIKAICKT